MEENIKIMLESALSSTPDIKVVDEPKPDIMPCVTFHFYGENGALFGGGKATEETTSCQIDIWYKVKKTEVTDAIKNIKKEVQSNKNFTYPKKDYVYESVNKIHHTYFTFDLIKESED